MFASYAKYFELYGDDVTAQDFGRIAWEADRLMHQQTTGADGVRKLTVAFPVDCYAAECVQRCECELVHLLHAVEQAERDARELQRVTIREDGTVARAAVVSVSSGSESISFAQGAGADAVSQAAANPAARVALTRSVIERNLSGIKDANGVNLLYMGVYPHVS